MKLLTDYRVIAACVLSLTSLCFAQPGSLDTAFNAGSLRGSVLAIAVQPDQRILAGGALTAGSLRNLVRLHADGSMDETFRTGTGPNDVVTGIALQADGKVLVGGRFTEFNGVAAPGIVRLNATGSIDASFSAGAAPDGFITAIKVQPDGRVLVAGEVFSYVPTSHRALVRLLPDGQADESFHVQISPVYTDFGGIHAMELLPDGRIYVTGPFGAINGAPRSGVARLLGNGAVDSAFAASDFSGNAIAVQPDDKVIIGGGFAAGPIGVVRLNPDGSTDGTFNGPLDSGADPDVQVIALQPDGRVLLGGVNFHVSVGDETPTVRDETLIRLEPDGDLDVDFLSGVQISAHGYASALAVLGNGKILVGVRETTGTPLFRLNNELVTGIEFTSTSFLVGEGDGVASITVRRTGPLNRAAHVRLNIEDGTATARQDYLGSSQRLSFRPGETQKTVRILIRQDSLVEGDETVLFSLEPGRGDLALRSSAILIIRDDDDDEPAPD
jgi:uncharacterized delta-60 repeat protein